jgi:hypothetical protein
MALRDWLSSFLKRFFVGSSTSLPEGFKNYTSLTRFIYQHGHFNATFAKPNAFLPGNQRKTSAALIDEMAVPQIWQLGDILGSLRPTPAKPKARADFDASILEKEKLIIEFDPEPHPRHVNLAGWPQEKDAQKNIANALCVGSRLRIRREP